MITLNSRRWVEKLAAEVRHEVGLRGDTVPLAAVVAMRLLGTDRVLLGIAGSVTALAHGRLMIACDHPDINHAVANTLAHWVLQTHVAFVGTLAETASMAGRLGSALIATPRAVRRGYAKRGEAGMHAMAKHFGFSDTTMHLRFGEVIDESRAVVTMKNRIITNDDAEWRTGSVPSLEIARGETKIPGIRSVPLRVRRAVDRGSVVLRHAS